MESVEEHFLIELFPHDVEKGSMVQIWQINVFIMKDMAEN